MFQQQKYFFQVWWHLTCNTWHMTCDTCHMTHDMLGQVTLLSKFQPPRSHGLRMKVYWITYSISDKAVWRTAWVMPGLLNNWHKADSGRLSPKLDEVDPNDNRPSTDEFYHLVQKRKKNGDRWYVTYKMWHVTHDMWKVTGGRRWTFSQFQLRSSYGLGLTVTYKRPKKGKAIK